MRAALIAATLTGLATGLGALPFLFLRELQRRVYDGILNEATVQANLAAGPESPPTSTPSNFAITTVTRNPTTGVITLVWNSEPAKNYVIQHSSTLAGWDDLPGTVPSGGTTTTAVVTPPAADLFNYYRIKLP